jgi:2-polyprenyl-3-methyl-5-hydroxy-6-metoxy-1,4-benzoquinol methylase
MRPTPDVIEVKCKLLNFAFDHSMPPDKMNQSTAPYVWQTHLDVSASEDPQYHEYLNPKLRDMFIHAPRLLLDIGCASGIFGVHVKEEYPAAKIVGIEINRAAAAIARTRLDCVLEGRIEDIDFAAAGIAAGSVDTVIAADVLEHMYDPWKVMAGLKPFLSPDAQVVASIPNSRNLILVAALLNNGSWSYSDAGLLDITHIRFFTQPEIIRFFHETGYQVKKIVRMLDGELDALYKQNTGKQNISIQAGKMTLQNLTQDELAELCTRQILVVATPRNE